MGLEDWIKAESLEKAEEYHKRYNYAVSNKKENTQNAG